MTVKQERQWKEMEKLLPELKRTFTKFNEAQKMAEDSEKRRALIDEINAETARYKEVSKSFVGIGIEKEQISFEEYGALLYFAKVTGLKPEKLFNSGFRWIDVKI